MTRPGGWRWLAVMSAPPGDAQGRLRRLPDRHLVVLRAALAGFQDAEIAVLLGIPVESVRPTLRLAAAKLVAVLAAPRHDGDRDPTGTD